MSMSVSLALSCCFGEGELGEFWVVLGWVLGGWKWLGGWVDGSRTYPVKVLLEAQVDNGLDHGLVQHLLDLHLVARVDVQGLLVLHWKRGGWMDGWIGLAGENEVGGERWTYRLR